jgi:hypothetical protein
VPAAVLREAPPGNRDLVCLPSKTRVATLVVAAKEQHDAIARRMAEDAQEDRTASRFGEIREACLPERGLFVVPDAKLEQTVAKVTPILGCADTYAFYGQQVPQGGHDGPALRPREVVVDPAADRVVSV